MTAGHSPVDLRNLWTLVKVGRRFAVGPRRAGQLVDQGLLPVAVLTPLGRLFDPVVVERIAQQHAHNPRTALAAAGAGSKSSGAA